MHLDSTTLHKIENLFTLPEDLQANILGRSYIMFNKEKLMDAIEHVQPEEIANAPNENMIAYVFFERVIHYYEL